MGGETLKCTIQSSAAVVRKAARLGPGPGFRGLGSADIPSLESFFLHDQCGEQGKKSYRSQDKRQPQPGFTHFDAQGP